MEKREIYPIAMLVMMLLISVAVYEQVSLNADGHMPLHWNAQGIADGYGNRFLGLFLLPIVAIMTYLLLQFIPQFDVYNENAHEMRHHLFGLKMALIIFFLTIHIATIEYSVAGPYNMSYVFIPAVSALFIFIGFLMRTVKRNFFIGIRTPWTLSSEVVWEKTHALGSNLFIGLGFLLPLSLLILDYFVWIFLGAVLIISCGLIIYSAREYNKLEKRGKENAQ